MTLKDYLNENDLFAADAGASIVEVREGYSRAVMKVVKGHLNAGGENGGYPPTKNGDIRSLLCA